MQKITPNLWFDSEAEEAVDFYVSIFKNSRVGDITRYTEGVSEFAGKPAGSVLSIDFELDGEHFIAINGGPMFKFTEAISLMVQCKDQEELDYFWEKLGEGGEIQQCGWLKDKYGLSWQVVPSEIYEIMRGPDTARIERVMKALMQMKKVDIAELRRAFDGAG